MTDITWNPNQNEDAYRLAVEVGNLEAATTECLTAIRRLRRIKNFGEVDRWEQRLRGVVARRRAIRRKKRGLLLAVS